MGGGQGLDELADAGGRVVHVEQFAGVGAGQIEGVFGDVDTDEDRWRGGTGRRRIGHAKYPFLRMRALRARRWRLRRLFG